MVKEFSYYRESIALDLSWRTVTGIEAGKNWNAWLITGMWHMKGTERNADKGIRILCSGKEDVKCTLLNCLKKRKWRMKV